MCLFMSKIFWLTGRVTSTIAINQPSHLRNYPTNVSFESQPFIFLQKKNGHVHRVKHAVIFVSKSRSREWDTYFRWWRAPENVRSTWIRVYNLDGAQKTLATPLQIAVGTPDRPRWTKERKTTNQQHSYEKQREREMLPHPSPTHTSWRQLRIPCFGRSKRRIPVCYYLLHPYGHMSPYLSQKKK